MMIKRLHEAMRVVLETERLWETSPDRAAARAALVVSRLVQSGCLEGGAEAPAPAALAAPAPADEAALPVVDRMTNGALPWASITVTDPLTDARYKNVDRRAHPFSYSRHLPRLPRRLSSVAWWNSPPEYRGMYERGGQDAPVWTLRPEYVDLWGETS